MFIFPKVVDISALALISIGEGWKKIFIVLKNKERSMAERINVFSQSKLYENVLVKKTCMCKMTSANKP